MSREEFEKWVYRNTLYPTAKFTNGDYIKASTGRLWQLWQAKESEIDALRARVAELEEENKAWKNTLDVLASPPAPMVPKAVCRKCKDTGIVRRYVFDIPVEEECDCDAAPEVDRG